MTIILPSHLSTSFVRNICWLNNGNTHLLALCAGEAPDERLKINELGPNLHSDLDVLLPGTTCYFRVIAENGFGSAQSSIGTFMTLSEITR